MLQFAICRLFYSVRCLTGLRFKKNLPRTPLHSYENTSFYIIRINALDKFGTLLKHRFSKEQINQYNAGRRP